MKINSKIPGWLVAAVVRLLAGYFAGRMGLDASEARHLGEGIVYVVISLIIAGLSLWHSIHDRQQIAEDTKNSKTGGDAPK